MQFEEYRKKAHETAEYPFTYVRDVLAPFIYPALGLAGEAGEVAEKIKKVIRNKDGRYNDEDVKNIGSELMDCVWYIAELCTVFGLDFDKEAQKNIDKLQDRKARNVIKSSGDNR